MISAVIIEDEPLIALQLQQKVQEVAGDVAVVIILPSLKAARRWLGANAMPDLFFMDIQLSDGVSFELFDEFSITSPVIFTTAYDEYALKAFKVNGIDYLLKPVENSELKAALEKARRFIGAPVSLSFNLQELIRQLHQPVKTPLYKEKFIVKVRQHWIPVAVNDIACFTRDNLIYMHCFSGEKYIVDYTTLDELEELLDPVVFFRANRQSIIHINAIESIQQQEGQKLSVVLRLHTKQEADISREKAPAFKKWLDR